MSFSLEFHPEAEKEYIEAYQWYENQLAGLGKKFEIRVDECLKQITDNPKHFRISKGQHREASLEVFPYTIVFKISKRKNTIYISAIYHHKRNPKYKYR